MQYIIKSPVPQELIQWFDEQPVDDDGNKINCRYNGQKGGFTSHVKKIVRQLLLEDQGHICCYTGIRITDDTFHIEHIKPQSVYYKNYEDIDYKNLLAAYPKSSSGSHPHGAHQKKDWYEEENFLSPLTPQCENAFQFTLEGEIKVLDENDKAAQTTMNLLKLNESSLTELRKEAIQSLLFDEDNQVTLEDVVAIYKKIENRNSKGQFRPFCFVLRQACEEYIKRKKTQTRNKAIQSQSKK
jgi:uncharacterized protein (TIGR02646 family)